MSAYSYERPRANRRRSLFIVTALVVALFGIDFLSNGWLRGMTRTAGAGISTFAGGAERAVFGGFFSTRARLAAQNAALLEQVAQYEARASGFDAIKAENDSLREFVHLAELKTGVTAPVVSSTRSSPYGTFLVGAGGSDGVASGALVVTGSGFVVGRVADVSEHTALVRELFAPSASVDGISGRVSLHLDGYGGGNARAQAPRGVVLAAGDTIFAPELGERPIGIIGHVASSTGAAAQDVYVRLPVNLETLQYVYVIQ